MSMGNLSDRPYQDNPTSPYQSGAGMPYSASRHSLLGMPTSDSYSNNNAFRHSTASPAPFGAQHQQRRMSSNIDFRSAVGAGPDDGAIVETIQNCLREVDLDHVTKKQGLSLPFSPPLGFEKGGSADQTLLVRALVEQRLQTELTGEKRVFLDRQIDNELANM